MICDCGKDNCKNEQWLDDIAKQMRVPLSVVMHASKSAIALVEKGAIEKEDAAYLITAFCSGYRRAMDSAGM